MASPGQKQGLCGLLMAGFDTHTYCARCRDQGTFIDPCITQEDCQFCNFLTKDQKARVHLILKKKKENVIRKPSKRSRVAPL